MPQDKSLRFYNMQISLVENNRLITKKAAVKRLWKKGNDIFFDIYFYHTHKSYVYDKHFIHDLVDNTTEQHYKTSQEFVEAYFQEEEKDTLSAKTSTQVVDSKILEPLDMDLQIMLYMAKCDKDITPVKEKIIFDYIRKHISAANTLSRQYLQSCLKELNPTIEQFYQSLKEIISKTPEEAAELLRECVKICLSDGRLHYNEKVCLAELTQVLRENGVECDVGL